MRGQGTGAVGSEADWPRPAASPSSPLPLSPSPLPLASPPTARPCRLGCGPLRRIWTLLW